MDKRSMEELKEMLCKELDEIVGKGELTAGALETVHKLTDTIKNIDKIDMLEEGGYSRTGYDRDGYDRDGYDRDGMWDARGTYGRGNSYAHRNPRTGRYSRDSGELMDKLERMMQNASTADKETIRRVMEEMKR